MKFEQLAKNFPSGMLEGFFVGFEKVKLTLPWHLKNIEYFTDVRPPASTGFHGFYRKYVIYWFVHGLAEKGSMD